MVTSPRVLTSAGELSGRWAAVFEEAGVRTRVMELASRFPEERALEVPFSSIEAADTSLADELLVRPEEVLDSGARAMRELLPVIGPEAQGLRLRVVGLPVTAHRVIREIRESDLNRFIAIDGIVRKATEVRPQIKDAVFSCAACRTEIHELQDETSPIFREPIECYTAQGGCGKPASRTRFRLLPDKSVYVDSQRIEVQENPESLKGGAHPQGLSILLTEDLTGRVIPGNRVVAVGTLKSLQRATASRTGVIRSTTFDLILLGNSLESQQREYAEIEVSEEELKEILQWQGDPTVVDRIVLSLAPTIKGMEEEKEAIALQLFGGVEKRQPDGIRIRGDITVLLVGDPGTAKSQLLRYIADVAPRGIYTSGKGATAAGLTAAAVKDDFAGGRWVLEAGMLVLADGGVAVIDELDKMTPEDSSAMHEALEQQSYHPEFELMFYNGEHRTIGTFVDALMEANPERIVQGNDCEILPLQRGRYSLLTTDFRGLSKVSVDRVSRHKAPAHFVRVNYRNGRSVTVTPEHPVFVWKSEGWTTVAAEHVQPGDLSPGVSEYPRELNEAVLRPPETRLGRKEIDFPVALDEDLSRLLGYVVSEGHVPSHLRRRTAEINVSNVDPGIATDVLSLFDKVFGVEPGLHIRPLSASRKATRPLFEIRAVGIDLLRYFQSNFPELARKSPEKRIPGQLFHASEECRVQFLIGAYRGDGYTDSGGFGLSTSSAGLARDYSDLLLSLGIYSTIAAARYSVGAHQSGTGYKVRISGSRSGRRFFDLVASHDRRRRKVQAFVESSENGKPNDLDRLPNALVKRLKRLLAEFRIDDGRYSALMESGGSSHRRKFEEYLRKVESRMAALPPLPADELSARDLRRTYCIDAKPLAQRLGRSVAWLYLHDKIETTRQGKEIRNATRALASDKLRSARVKIEELRGRVESPLRFTPVRSVETVPNCGEEWVYDVTVEPTHRFVSEGLVLHNTVSISKAGITATLNARCTVLAAANPRFGRFTPDRSFAEQVNLPPTLLSRFDVIYSIFDKPDRQRDRLLANRILESHRAGEARELGAEFAESPSGGAPFPPDFLRKYIAYARRTFRPVLSAEALSALEDYYVQVRKQGEAPDAPVPITARQLEALVRLSEASARARLSNVVSLDDAKRAIKIVTSFLARVATSEGQLDIDTVTTGVSHSQRERMDLLYELMRKLQADKGYFSLEELRAEAEKAGVPPSRTDALFYSLRNQGEVAEHRPNQWQLIRF